MGPFLVLLVSKGESYRNLNFVLIHFYWFEN